MSFRDPRRGESTYDWLVARDKAIDRKVARMDRDLEARIVARLAKQRAQVLESIGEVGLDG